MSGSSGLPSAPPSPVMSKSELRAHQFDTEYIGLGSLLETGLYSDVEVSVGTGEEGHTYKLHKAVLALNSGYFRTIIASGFKEAQEDKITLPEHEQTIFEFVVHYLYHGAIKEPSSRSKRWHLNVVAKIFSYASYFDIPGLKKRSIEYIVLMIRDQRFEIFDGSKMEPQSIEALQILFKSYHADKALVDKVLMALSEVEHVTHIILNEQLRGVLLEEPELTMKLLELKLGV